MTATAAMEELVASYPAPKLAPLSQALVRCLDLPPDLAAELSIAEVSELTGVSAHALRYYERIGLVEVSRNAAGHRVYDRDALARVVFVNRLRSSDMPIRTISRYVELVKQGPATEPQRLALMQEHRTTILRRLAEMQAALAVIEYKITTYGGACGP